MRCVIAGESNQHHVNDGQNRKSGNADHRQCKQRLVELIVQKRLQIVLAALDLLTLGSNIEANAALLDLQSPGVNKSEDKDKCQQCVQKHLDRVIAGLPNLKDLTILLNLNKSALYVTDGCALLEEVGLAQPVQTAAGNEHICEENHFKKKEENTAKDLSIEQITNAEDNEGKPYCPVTPLKGASDIQHLVPQPKPAILEKAEDGEQNAQEPRRDRAEKQLQVIEKRLKLI